MFSKINLNLIYLIFANLIIFGFTHEGNHEGSQGFFDPNLEHIKEDVKDYYHIELDNKTSDKELDFYYFQMHDFDHNLLLDGLEILTALNHAIDENSLKSREETTTAAPQGSGRMHPASDAEEQEDPMEFYRMKERFRSQIRWNEKFDQDSKTIDQLLQVYDKDNDGFISYSEYTLARAQNNANPRSK